MTAEITRMDEIFAKMGKARYFTAIDATAGYMQFFVKESSRDYTAFHTHRGQFRFVKMPFGLAGSGFTYVRGMQICLRGCEEFVIFYIDDIFVFSLTLAEHTEHVKTVLTRLYEDGFTLSPEKLQLGMRRVKILGHIVGEGEIRPDPEKVVAISKYPAPHNPKAILRFLGMVGFFREYIPEFGKTARPLYNLTRKNIKWKWTEIEQGAFEILRDALISNEVLALPVWDKPFHIQCDASYDGIGACLMQEGVKGLRPIMFISRSLSPAEKNYCITELECLALIYAVTKFRSYIEMSEVIAESDHQALQTIMSIDHPTGRLYRWMLRLMPLNMLIKHRKGSTMMVADPLSRAPHGPETDPQVSWVDKFIPIEDPKMEQRLRFEDYKHKTPGHSCERCSDKAPKEVSSLAIARHIRKDEKKTKVFRVSLEEPDDHPCTVEDWATAQAVDSEIGFLEAQVRAKNPQTLAKGYELSQHGLLIKRGADGVWKIVVPGLLRRAVCQVNHDHCLSGHTGIKRTIERIARSYTWKNMVRDVTWFVRGCDTCQKNRPSNRAPAGLMAAEIPCTPFSHLSCDFIGPLPHGTFGFAFAFIIMCDFTKNLEIYPLKRATAANSADCVIDFCCRYGFPSALRSDNGCQMSSKIWKIVCEKLKIKQRFICTYRQKGNPAERYIQTCKTTIRPYLEKHRDWHKFIPMILFALRSSRHRTTGQTPAKMTFGRELRSPFSLTITARGEAGGQGTQASLKTDPEAEGQEAQAARPKDPEAGGQEAQLPEERESPWQQASTYAADLTERLEEAFRVAKTQIDLEYGRRERAYNTGRRENDIGVGDLVLRLKHGISSADKQETKSLMDKYEGPFKISEIIEVNTFELSNLKGERIGRANADQLKLYFEQPLWARDPIDTPDNDDDDLALEANVQLGVDHSSLQPEKAPELPFPAANQLPVTSTDEISGKLTRKRAVKIPVKPIVRPQRTRRPPEFYQS